MSFVKAGIVYQHIKIFYPVFNSVTNGFFNIRLQYRGNIHVFEAKSHVLAADTADRNGVDSLLFKPFKIHIPQLGYINAVLTVVVNKNDDVFFLFIFHNGRYILIKPCRILGKI